MQRDDNNPQQHEQLGRICQQGMKRAAEMLTLLLQQPIAVEVEDLWMTDQARSKAQPREIGIGIFLTISGELNGGVQLFFPETIAEWICCRLLRKGSVENLLIEPASSTLKEVGNIFASTFLGSLETQLGLGSLPSPPTLRRAPIEQLLGAELQDRTEPGMMIRSRLFGEKDLADPLQGTVYLFLESGALQLLAAKLKDA